MKRVPSNHPSLWLEAFPFPKPEQHKYDRGHAVVVGGPYHQTGAARLAAQAALRVGTGVVSVVCEDKSLPIYATTLMAVITKVANTAEEWETLLEDPRMRAVIAGPGNRDHARAKAFVRTALAAKKRMVIDADALSCFAAAPRSLFKAIQSDCILTPHETEFVRLFGKLGIGEDMPREERALEAARISGAVVVLKGNETVIVAPDGRIAKNAPASSWLATAGSGDVLAGMCGGLLAQGMDAFLAACCAVWMHAMTARQFGPLLTAEDIAPQLPGVMRELLK